MVRLTKNRKNKIIDGVLSGVANYIKIDPVIVRIIYLIFAFTIDFGTAFILYIVGMIIMPNSDTADDEGWGTSSFSSMGGNTWIGAILVVLGAVFLFNNVFDFNITWIFREMKEYVWPLLIIAIGVFLIFRSTGKKR